MARVIGTLAIAVAMASVVISAQALTAADAGAFMGSWTLRSTRHRAPSSRAWC